jgi:hypothetical protein
MSYDFMRRPVVTPTNSSRYTISCWVKRDNLNGNYQQVWGSLDSGSGMGLFFDGNDKISFWEKNTSGQVYLVSTSAAVFDDTTNWYHIVVVVNGASGFNGDKCRITVNGQEITSYSQDDRGSLNTGSTFINSTNHPFVIGRKDNNTYHFRGQISDLYFIDGSAESATVFGFEDPETGEWKPRSPVYVRAQVTFGANGSYHPLRRIDDTYGIGTAHRYWRYVEGTTVQGHHPRISRIWLVKKDGSKVNAVVYTSDNQSDVGTYQVGTTTTFDAGTPIEVTGYGVYHVTTTYRASYATLQWSDDGSNWNNHIVGLTACWRYGEYEWDFKHGFDYKTANRSSNLDITEMFAHTNRANVSSPTNNFNTINELFVGSPSGAVSSSNAGVSTDVTSISGDSEYATTIPLKSGKWYFEFRADDLFDSWRPGLGPTFQMNMSYNNTMWPSGTTMFWQDNGTVYRGGGSYASAAGFSVGQILGWAFDLDNNKCWFRNSSGNWVSGNPATNSGGTAIYRYGNQNDDEGYMVYGRCNGGNAGSGTFNFGDGSFVQSNNWQGYSDSNGVGKFQYQPPAGFLAICEDNKDDLTIVPEENFKIIPYTGNATARSITGLGFKPDLVVTWSRNSSSGYYPAWHDSVRGGNKAIFTNVTNTEYSGTDGTLSSFDNDGFSLNSGGGYGNSDGGSYAAYCWKAGGTAVTNNDGSVSAQVSANPAAGFSIITATQPSSGDFTVGHGLGKKPAFIMSKVRNVTYNWDAWCRGMGTIDRTMKPNTVETVFTDRRPYTSTEPTDSVFTVRGAFFGSGSQHVFYVWSEIEGYSQFGRYRGQSNSKGRFVTTGFRPAYVMIKPLSGTSSAPGTGWRFFDNVRNTYNTDGVQNALYWERGGSNNEVSQNGVDFCSNGFKLMPSADKNHNETGAEYIYMAFAENPYGKLARAR